MERSNCFIIAIAAISIRTAITARLTKSIAIIVAIASANESIVITAIIRLKPILYIAIAANQEVYSDWNQAILQFTTITSVIAYELSRVLLRSASMPSCCR